MEQTLQQIDVWLLLFIHWGVAGIAFMSCLALLLWCVKQLGIIVVKQARQVELFMFTAANLNTLAKREYWRDEMEKSKIPPVKAYKKRWPPAPIKNNEKSIMIDEITGGPSLDEMILRARAINDSEKDQH